MRPADPAVRARADCGPRPGCPGRCPVPGGHGTLCLETGDLLPAGPCRGDCAYGRDAGRGGRPA